MSGVTVSTGGTVELVGGAALPPGLNLLQGAILALGSGEVFSGFRVGGILVVASGGTASGTTILNGGRIPRSFPPAASRATPTCRAVASSSCPQAAWPIRPLFSAAVPRTSAPAAPMGASISGGGKLFIQSGGTAIDITIFSGGSAINSAGGKLDVVVSAMDSGALVNSGTVNVQMAVR